jgi:hypothetical protein
LLTKISGAGSSGSRGNELAELAQNIHALRIVGDLTASSHKSGLGISETILEHLSLDLAAALIHVVAKLTDLLRQRGNVLVYLIKALDGIDQSRIILLEHLVGLIVDKLSRFIVVIRGLDSDLLKLSVRTLGVQLIGEVCLRYIVSAVTAESEVSARQKEQSENPEKGTAAAKLIPVTGQQSDIGIGKTVHKDTSIKIFNAPFSASFRVKDREPSPDQHPSDLLLHKKQPEDLLRTESDF